jgi:hypothetical protein
MEMEDIYQKYSKLTKNARNENLGMVNSLERGPERGHFNLQMEHTVSKCEREKGDLLEEYKELESDYDELDKVNRKLNKELTDHMATIRYVSYSSFLFSLTNASPF